MSHQPCNNCRQTFSPNHVCDEDDVKRENAKFRDQVADEIQVHNMHMELEAYLANVNGGTA